MELKYLVDGHDKDQKVFFSDSFMSYDAAKSHASDLEDDFNLVTIRKVETEEIYNSAKED